MLFRFVKGVSYAWALVMISHLEQRVMSLAALADVDKSAAANLAGHAPRAIALRLDFPSAACEICVTTVWTGEGLLLTCGGSGR